jgi:serine/threonine-protein kinase RsbW
MPETSTRQPVKNLLRMRIPCTGEPVFKARKRMGDLARRLGFHGEKVDSILLAFSEAVTNALVYGNATVRKCVRVRAWVENSRLVVEVSDHGKGFSPGPVHLPPASCMCEGGRGLYLMRVLMDDVQWHATPEGTTVRMAICCVSPQPSPEAAVPASALPVPVSR